VGIIPVIRHSASLHPRVSAKGDKKGNAIMQLPLVSGVEGPKA